MIGRTDRALGLIKAQLDARRTVIDGADGLRRLEVVVYFNEQTGYPEHVLYRVEEACSLTRKRRAC